MYGNYWKALCVALIVIENAALSSASRSKADSEILATFDDPVQIFGDMIRNNIDFVDGLNVDVYSPTNRTLTVSKNTSPMTGRFTSGTRGGAYRGLSGYSYILQTNDIANDVIARVQIPWDPTTLNELGVDPSNSFVGKLAADNQSWVIQDDKLDVDKAVFKSRVNQLTSLSGEYRLVGRMGPDIGSSFQAFGSGPQTIVQVAAGGRQDVEFIDGLRFSVLSDVNLTMNVDIFSPITPDMIPEGMKSLYAFGYVVNTTQTDVLAPAAPLPPSSSTGLGASGLAPPASNGPVSVTPKATATSLISGEPGAPSSSAMTGTIISGFGVGGVGVPVGGSTPLPSPGDGNKPKGPGEGSGDGRRGSGKGEGGSSTHRAKMIRRQNTSINPSAPASQSIAGPPLTSIAASGAPSPAPPPPPGPVGPTPTSVLPAPPPVGPSGSTVAVPPPSPTGSISVTGSSPSGTGIPPAIPPPAPPGAANISASAVTISAGPAATAAARTVRAADLQFPINMAVLMRILGTNNPNALQPNSGNGNAQGLLGESTTDMSDTVLRNIKFQIARRDVGANTQRFTPMVVGSENNGNGAANAPNMQLSIDGGNLRFNGAQQLDGEYIVLVPAEMIAQGQAPIQKTNANAGTVLGVEIANVGAAFAIIMFAALLI